MIQFIASRLTMSLATLALLFSTHAFAQDNQALANAPDLKVGDRWEYVRKDVFTGNELGRYSLEVIAIEGDDVTFKRSDLGDGPSTTFKTKRDMSNEFNRDGVDYLFRPVMFPSVVGQRWESTSRGRSPGGDPIRNIMTMRVVGTEAVVTTAGTFDAIRIEGNGTWQNLKYPRTHAGEEETIWYAPAVKRIVKTRFVGFSPPSGSPNGSSEELTSYSLVDSDGAK